MKPSDYRTFDEMNTRELMLLNAEQAIDAIPAADVAEVRHGKWIDTSTKRECSLCGTAWRWSDNEADRFRYCPNCGARMGKSEDEDNV